MGRDRKGVENKKFYVSSRDTRIVCSRLYGWETQTWWEQTNGNT